MDKRGLSTVISVMIIILLALVLIGILWVVISGILQNQSEDTKSINEFFSEQAVIDDIDFDYADSFKGSISIKKLTGVTRNIGNETIFGLVDVDLISVVDLSPSMYACTSSAGFRGCICSPIDQICCTDTFGINAVYDNVSGSCSNVSSDRTNKCTNVCGGRWNYGVESEVEANKFLVENLSTYPGDTRVGLVAYNTPFLPLYSLYFTQNLQDLNTIINSWSINPAPSGGTCICCGIRNATNWFLSSGNKTKIMIVMSDGTASVYCNGTQDPGKGPSIEAVQEACDANATFSNLIIHSVGFQLQDDPSRNTLRNISKCGGGEYFDANDSNQLIDAYEEIAGKIFPVYQSTHKFTFLRIIFYGSENTQTYIDVDVPDVLETRDYDFNLTGTGLIPPIIKVEVYPVIIQPSGEELIGPRLDYWT